MRQTIGQLNCLVRPGENEKNAVVLMHGFGADNTDLFPLADVLDPNGEWSFYFPNAPYEVPVSPMWTGRGWFPLSIRDLEEGLDFTKIRPTGMNESAQTVSDFLFHLEPKKLVLGGFSQGAMIAADVALSQPEDIAGLVLYSPTLLDEANWTKKAANLKGKKILLSHGQQDMVLPFSRTQQLYELFRKAEADCQLISFGGGHEIPMPVLQKTKELLSKV